MKSCEIMKIGVLYKDRCCVIINENIDMDRIIPLYIIKGRNRKIDRVKRVLIFDYYKPKVHQI